MSRFSRIQSRSQIRFRYATTLPDGNPMTTFVESLTVVYGVGWNIWINALRADAKSSNDSVAIASLPATALVTSLVESSANGRALGQNTPPAMNSRRHGQRWWAL